MTDSELPAKYDVAKVEAVILEVAAELDPQHLTVVELTQRIVTDPDDHREIATAVRAIRDLRECGLCAPRHDEIVEPTAAAVRAVKLLT
jgi:hypothetical protein